MPHILVVACLIMGARSFEKVSSQRYVFQNASDGLPWPRIPLNDVNALVSTGKAGLFAVSNASDIFLFQEGKITHLNLSSSICRLTKLSRFVFEGMYLVVATPGPGLCLYTCNLSIARCDFRSQTALEGLTAVENIRAGPDMVWIASNRGLHSFDLASGAVAAAAPGPAGALAVSPSGRLVAVAVLEFTAPGMGDGPDPHTAAAVLVLDRAHGVWQHFWAGGVMDGNATALEFEGERLWVGMDVCIAWATFVAVGPKMAWKFSRVGGLRENPGSVVRRSY
jgi:hypothetical protein